MHAEITISVGIAIIIALSFFTGWRVGYEAAGKRLSQINRDLATQQAAAFANRPSTHEEARAALAERSGHNDYGP
jgi:hypothetical protein